MVKVRRRLVVRTAGVTAVVAVSLLAAQAGGASGRQAASGTAPAQSLTKLTFMLPIPVRSLATFPFNVAESAGFYRQEGLDVKILTSKSAAFAIQQMAAGKVDIALSTAGAGLNAFAQKLPVKAVCELFQGQVFSIWVPAASSIRKFGDLRNKRIGVESLQGGHIPELTAFLAAAGLTPGKNVKLVPLGDDAATVIAAFKGKKVDAYDLSFAFNPGPRLALKLRSVPSPAQIGQTAQEPLLARSALIRQNPAAVAGFLRAVAKAIVFGNANASAVFAIQRKVFPPELESMPFARLLLQTSLQTMAGAKQLSPNAEFCRMKLSGWRQLMKELTVPGVPGALSRTFNVAPYVDNGFVKRVNAFNRQQVVAAARKFKG